MPRTTSDNVQTIIELEEGDDLTAFILTANELVTEICASVKKADGTDFYGAGRLELIERWLAAHFYAVLRPRPFLEQIDVLRVQNESKVDIGLDVTRYGQQAMRLDTQGGLAVLNNSLKKAIKPLPAQNRRKSLTWLGKPLE